MKTYLVGGAVRDIVMGIEPKDRDYVVVGSTPSDMRALGYTQVGASFPVFLSPSGEEYALARTEKKVGVGYHGFDVSFDPSVTLEEDLIRRDLTMNSMAMDLDTGEIIDPHGGQQDIALKIVRHTSEAFAEDPVRVLRAARLAARYSFSIDQTTTQLMRQVAVELEHVASERVVAEFSKSISDKCLHDMCKHLSDVGAHTIHPVAWFDVERAAVHNMSTWSSSAMWAILLTSIAQGTRCVSGVGSIDVQHARDVLLTGDSILTYSSLDPASRICVIDALRITHSQQRLDEVQTTLAHILQRPVAICDIVSDTAKLQQIDWQDQIQNRPAATPMKDWTRQVRIAALE